MGIQDRVFGVDGWHGGVHVGVLVEHMLGRVGWLFLEGIETVYSYWHVTGVNVLVYGNDLLYGSILMSDSFEDVDSMYVIFVLHYACRCCDILVWQSTFPSPRLLRSSLGRAAG